MGSLFKALDSMWSVACIVICGGAICTFLYWVVIQQPELAVNTDGMITEYTAPAGSVLYVENPIFPPDTVAQIDLSAELLSEDISYRLASPSDTHQRRRGDTDTQLQTGRPGYPMYPIFIPSYVKAGVYKYIVTAEYKLNPFRSATLELPPLTLTIY